MECIPNITEANNRLLDMHMAQMAESLDDFKIKPLNDRMSEGGVGERQESEGRKRRPQSAK